MLWLMPWGARHERTLARRQHAAMQEYGLRVITDVVTEPIGLTEAKLHLRVDGATDDDWLRATIPAAREFCESYLGRSLATKTLERSSHRFPTIAIHSYVGPYIELPFGPVQSVTSVQYVSANEDSAGNYATLDFADSSGLLCELDRYVTPNRLVLKFGESWPAARASVNAVKIRYVAGYVAAADSSGDDVLPKTARAAMLLLLGHLYENREATAIYGPIELPLGVQALLDSVPGRENLGMP